jgi:hypothetical protein
MACHPFLRERLCVLLFMFAVCRNGQSPAAVRMRTKQNPGRWTGAQNRMLHLHIVHRALDVKRPRYLCKARQHCAFCFSLRHSPLGFCTILLDLFELVNDPAALAPRKHSQCAENKTPAAWAGAQKLMLH